MKPINRIKENWSPKWDLGLQDEFGFSLQAPVLESRRPGAWSMATREVLNRQEPTVVTCRRGDGTPEEVVSFLETLSKELSRGE